MKEKLRYIYLIAFVVVAYILLPVMNSDYLYTIQDCNVFISGHTFMMDVIDHQGGWGAWIACYLTQFFYYPWLGSTILIALWVVIYLLTHYLFRIKDKFSPIALILPALLLFNVLDYGYWIYYTKTPGFPFQPTLALLFILLCAILLQPLLCRTQHGKWFGRLLPYNLCLIGMCVCLLFIFRFMKTNVLNNHCSSFLITLTDNKFKHEMRMYRALDEFRFEDVVKEMETFLEEEKGKEEDGEEETYPTSLMVLYKNIALMHTGQMNRMFELNNCGTMPHTGDSLQVHISQLGGALIYYQFGQINYAYRRAMESAVKYGLSFRNLKMLARTALLNREFEMAEKYLTMLKTSTFHHKWAMEREGWIFNSTQYLQSREYQTIAPLLQEDVNTLDDDQGLCEKYLLEHFSDLTQASSPLLEDLIMCMSLWSKDAYSFCVHFYDYAHNHPDETIPMLYQEGAILLANAEDSPIDLNGFRFDELVADKFNRFVSDYNTLLQLGLSEKEMAGRLRPKYGTTYWWYYYFHSEHVFY